MWEQDIGLFAVDFAGQGDEWSYHLRVKLTGDSHMAARGTDGTAPVELGPPSSGPVRSRQPGVHRYQNRHQMFTVDQVAEILGISRDMMYDLLRTGQLRSIKIGHLRRISGQWVTEFVERTVTAGP